MTFSGFLVQLLNGLSGASSLFLVGAGLSLIFGVTRIVNFAYQAPDSTRICTDGMRTTSLAFLLVGIAVSSTGCSLVGIRPVGAGSSGIQIPAIFDHDRIVVVAPSVAHPAMRFYADSGGGYNAVDEAAAKRLDLKVIGTLPAEGDGVGFPLVAFPDAMIRAGIPPSRLDGPFVGGLAVVPVQHSSVFTEEGNDGFLGGRWFDGHAWEIDYVHRTLRLLQRVAPPERAHRVALNFQTGENALRTTGFARLEIVVAGEPLQMLFDTGARATLAAGAAAVLDRPVGTRVGTSFITRSVFERWAARHPDWRVIRDGDRVIDGSLPMIEVPHISIGGLTTGPVWFTQRRDDDFRVFMSSMMDAPIDGAIGGSALRLLRITIDYPAAVAYFEAPAP
jgi:hypothetical protein